MSDENETEANRFFREHAGLRERVRQSKDFTEWRKAFKEIEMEGNRYFVAPGEPMVSGGDHLMDEDELLLEWAKQSGLPLAPEKEGGQDNSGSGPGDGSNNGPDSGSGSRDLR